MKERYFVFFKDRYYRGGNIKSYIAHTLYEFRNKDDFAAELKKVFCEQRKNMDEREREEQFNEMLERVKNSENWSCSFQGNVPEMELTKVSTESVFKYLPFEAEDYFYWINKIPFLNITEKDEEQNFKEDVKNTIDFLGGIHPSAFYTALLLYDVGGITEPTNEQIKKAYVIQNECNSIYNDETREQVNKINKEIEENCKEDFVNG